MGARDASRVVFMLGGSCNAGRPHVQRLAAGRKRITASTLQALPGSSCWSSALRLPWHVTRMHPQHVVHLREIPHMPCAG